MMKVVLIASSLAITTQWIPRELPYRPLCTLVWGLTILFTGFLLYRFRDRNRYDERLVRIQAAFSVISVHAGLACVGIYSGVIIAGALGIFFWGSSDDKKLGWMVYVVGTGGYAVLQVLSIVGVMPLDRGLVAVYGADPDLPGLITLSLELQAFLAFTFWSARKIRAATRDAFLRLEGAARRIEQREALLDEARADLDRGEAVRLGRYTGQAVDDYMVDELIGRGGMGEVYAARASDGSPAALKFLSPGMLEEPGVLTRFLREAEVVRTLESPHVTRIFGTGQAEDGAHYIAMERLYGEDLAKRLRKKQRLGSRETQQLIAQVAAALEVARANGIVHRDIKPQNLFLTSEGGRKRWKVLDFGVSKLRESQATLTQGGLVGTPSYMSPEQAQGVEVDHRTDVFALGVVAYRALTGRPAFTAADSVLTVYNVIYKQPVRPSELVKLPPDVERVLALVLSKRRELRPPSARQFAEALEQAFAGKLPPKLRSAADELAAREPWGVELRPSDDAGAETVSSGKR